MADTSLCEYCAKIIFSHLKLPTVESIRNGDGAAGFFIPEGRPGGLILAGGTYSLGHWDRVKHLSVYCTFCLLLQAILAVDINEETVVDGEHADNLKLVLFSHLCMSITGERIILGGLTEKATYVWMYNIDIHD